MAFRSAPRTVWGTRRWFLGRDMVTIQLPEQTFVRFIYEEFGVTNRSGRAPLKSGGGSAQRYYRQISGELTAYGKKYEEARARGETKREKQVASWGAKWSSRVYYANQIARTMWWYAQSTGAIDSFEDKAPGLASAVNLLMGVSTGIMGMVATSTAIVGALGTGQPWMAAVAALSLPIQMDTLMTGFEETIKNENLRAYFAAREKRLAEHTYGGG